MAQGILWFTLLMASIVFGGARKHGCLLRKHIFWPLLLLIFFFWITRFATTGSTSNKQTEEEDEGGEDDDMEKKLMGRLIMMMMRRMIRKQIVCACSTHRQRVKPFEKLMTRKKGEEGKKIYVEIWRGADCFAKEEDITGIIRWFFFEKSVFLRVNEWRREGVATVLIRKREKNIFKRLDLVSFKRREKK